MAGVAEARQAGQLLGIEVVAGVEISTRAGGKEIHVLGYEVDVDDERFLQRLRGLREAREERNHRMIAKLQELGPISLGRRCWTSWGGRWSRMKVWADHIWQMCL